MDSMRLRTMLQSVAALSSTFNNNRQRFSKNFPNKIKQSNFPHQYRKTVKSILSVDLFHKQTGWIFKERLNALSSRRWRTVRCACTGERVRAPPPAGARPTGACFTGINLRMCTGAAPAEIREVSQGRSGCRGYNQAAKQLEPANMNNKGNLEMLPRRLVVVSDLLVPLKELVALYSPGRYREIRSERESAWMLSITLLKIKNLISIKYELAKSS